MEKQEMREMTTIEKIRKEFEEYKNQKKLDFGNFYFCNPSHQLVFTDSFSGKNYRQDSMKYTISYAAEIILSRIEADYAAKETKLQTLSERFIEETTVKGYYGNVGLGVYAISWLDKLTGITYKTDYNRLNIYGPYTQLYFFIKEECNKTLAKEETIVDRIKNDADAYLKYVSWGNIVSGNNFTLVMNQHQTVQDDRAVTEIHWRDPVTKLDFTEYFGNEHFNEVIERLIKHVEKYQREYVDGTTVWINEAPKHPECRCVAETIVNRVERDCKAYVSQIVARAYNFDYNDIHDNIFWIDPVTKLKFTTDIDSESCDDQAEDIVEQVKRFHENQQSESGLDRMVAEVQEAIYNLLKKNAEEEKEREAKAEARKEAEARYEQCKKDVNSFLENVKSNPPAGYFEMTYSAVNFVKDSNFARITWMINNSQYETWITQGTFSYYCDQLLYQVKKDLGIAS